MKGYKIDRDKFASQMKRLKLTNGKIADAVGCEQSSVSNWKVRGIIGVPYALALEKVFGITPEMYAPDPEKTPVTIERKTEMDYDMLQKTITTAVFNALVSISGELENQLGRIVGSNVKAGIREAIGAKK